jgi:threonine dehydratase
MIGLSDIEDARRRIADAIHPTPCIEALALSEKTGVDLRLKLETLQRTGSFKARGAVNTLRSLLPEERRRGVVAASAGNHAQGVAYAATLTGTASLIVMPRITPLIKISRTRALGGLVELAGNNFDEAYGHALALAAERSMTFVSAFDDDRVIAGQGTIGLELLEQVPELEAVIVPIGGGGVISGIAAAVKALTPRVAVYGVQTESAPAVERSYREGRVVEVVTRRSIADGITIKRPAERTLAMIRRFVDDVRLVSEEDIESAIFHLLESAKVVVEGAGAAGLAAVLAGRFPELAGKRTAVVLCGANIDLNMLSRIVERSLVRLHRVVQLGITIRDTPGGLAGLLALLAEREANVLEVHHERLFGRQAFFEVKVHVSLETKSPEHVEELLAALAAAGYARVEILGDGAARPSRP